MFRKLNPIVLLLCALMLALMADLRFAGANTVTPTGAPINPDGTWTMSQNANGFNLTGLANLVTARIAGTGNILGFGLSGAGGGTYWNLTSDASFDPAVDNSYDIGRTSTLRPRALYLGTGSDIGNATGGLIAGAVNDTGGYFVNGSPAAYQVATADLATQAADVGATTLYAVPASGSGMYRFSCYSVVTQAATSSSTLPSCEIIFTDKDTNTTQTWGGVTGTNAGNVVGASTLAGASRNGGVTTFNAKASTNIQFATVGYASSGATPMQFSIHVRLEWLGN